MRVSLGIYTGNAEKFASALFKKFTARIISTTASLTEQLGFKKTAGEVQNFLQMVSSYDDIVSEEKTDCASDVAEEMLPYVDFGILADGLREIAE